jgi:ABC-type amino acid transport substrate-binding protein
MTRRRPPWLLALVSLALLAACARTSAPPTSTADDDPLGLAAATWPIDPTALEPIFAALPGTLAGIPSTDAPYLTANYGDGKKPAITIYAVDLGSAACPGLAGASLVRSTLERDGRVHVATQSPDQLPAGVPAYVIGTREGRSVAGWSVPDANWVVVVEAATPALRTAAIRAVVEAAGTS